MSTTQNRQAFFHDISSALGRQQIPDHVEPLDLSKGPQYKLMTGMSHDERVEAFKKECNTLAIKFRETDKNDLANNLMAVIREYGGGKIIYPQVNEITEFHLDTVFQENQGRDGLNFVAWDHSKGSEYNITHAENANIGVTFPLMAIAETGTIIQPASIGSGRSVGLLPLTHIAVLRRSTILPRMTQTMKALARHYHEDPELFPSLLVHISGPSSTVDIELVRVVGVHGPINVTYIILND
ncbi:MAG: lactate utilization protein C [Deltaproteobacteria bacterium]|nr:MAG: lactate utilization protein C [Deltaproteobacteria bacterium]